MRARWRLAACVVAGALLLRALYGPPRLGYDAWYALEWGRELAHGHSPDLGGSYAPTPHPLATAVSAVASLFGQGGVTVIAVISLVALAALGAATFLFASRLFGVPAGVLATAFVLTRPLVVDETLFSSVDVPFLALVVGAGASLAGNERRHGRAVWLLIAAGLLRPEAWLLAAALAASRLRAGVSPWKVAAGFAAAPVVWGLHDLVLSGDALHSLHVTQALTQQFGRPHSAGRAVTAIPGYLESVLGDRLAWAGALGALVALWYALERAALPLAVLALGLLAFLVLGVAELPLLVRYALLPSVALCVLAAFAGFAWLGEAGERPVLVVAALAVAALAIGSVGGGRRALLDVRAANRGTRSAQADLARVVRYSAVRAAVGGCADRVAVPAPRAVPEVAYRLGIAADRVRLASARAVVLQPASVASAAAYRLVAGDRLRFPRADVAGRMVVRRTPAWIAYSCG